MATNYSPKIVSDQLYFYFDSQRTQNYVGSTVTSAIGTKQLTATNVTRSGIDTTFTNTDNFYAASYLIDSAYDSNLIFGPNKTASVSFYNTRLLDVTALGYWRQTPFSCGTDGLIGQFNFERFYRDSFMYFRFKSDTGPTYGDQISFGEVPLNQWVNLTAVNNGDSILLYKNGIQVQNASVTGQTINSPSNIARLCVGASGNNTTPLYGFIGKVDSAMFYNKALTQTEIMQNYNALKGRYGL